MNTVSLISGVLCILIALGTIWVALPTTGTISRAWLRSQAGVLYPLIPVGFLVFGIFLVLSAFGLA